MAGYTHRGLLFLALFVALAAPMAGAELNLWISYHFTGIEADDSGSYRDSEILLLQALEEDQPGFREAQTRDGLGQVYTALGDFEGAERYYREALALKAKSLGKRHREVPQTLNNLADLLYIQDKLEEVEGLYRRALEINERDQLNLDVCRSFNGLALIHNRNGESVEAERLLQRAIALHDKAQRRDHPYLATVLTNLGILYTNLGRYDEAAPLFERARYIQDKVLRDGHPDASLRMHATAALWKATGRLQEAGKLAAQADAIREDQADAGNLY